MTHNVIPLYPNTPRGGVGVREPGGPAGQRLHCGRLYGFQFQGKGRVHPPAGMVGDYRFDIEQARLDEPTHSNGNTHAYVYDIGAARDSLDWRYRDSIDGQPYQFTGNHLILKYTELGGPELLGEGPLTHLVMRPVFHLIYSSEAHEAELGVIHLVQSQRFISLSNGERFSLLDAEEPILYVPADGGESAIDSVVQHQPQGQNCEYTYSLQLKQPIPAQLGGVEVESVTVLEQYQSYFMQREYAQGDEVIWTPALAPVSWAWSMRVGRRSDQHWGILRRKLVLPTVGHDGLEFPLWEENHHALSRRLPDER